MRSLPHPALALLLGCAAVVPTSLADSQVGSWAALRLDGSPVSWTPQYGFALGSGDFNGDGRDDLIVGMPMILAAAPMTPMGAVGGGFQVYFGQADGSLAPDLAQQTLSGALGTSFAAGDFDGDGRDEIAIGAPEDSTIQPSAGSVTLLDYQPGGSWSESTINADSNGIPGSSVSQGRFGRSLAAGDFNDDGFDDLAIGVPGEEMVIRIRGSLSGLEFTGVSMLHRGTAGVPGDQGNDERFGWALAFCDFNGDGFDDLAIGAPDTHVAGFNQAGEVVILEGSTTEMVGDPVAISQNNTPGAVEFGDFFGDVLACGNVGAPNAIFSAEDLAVASTGENVGSIADAGAVTVIFGGNGELDLGTAQLWTSDDFGVASETSARFGQSLAVGNLIGFSAGDLAIGAYATAGNFSPAEGRVVVLEGGTAGVGNLRSFHFGPEGSAGIDAGETGNVFFGNVLAAGDFNGDNREDLAIGAPLQDLPGEVDAGVVHVMFNSDIIFVDGLDE